VKCVVYASSAGACGPPDDYLDGIVDDTSVHRPTNHCTILPPPPNAIASPSYFVNRWGIQASERRKCANLLARP
jgi:hypothetical protein